VRPVAPHCAPEGPRSTGGAGPRAFRLAVLLASLLTQTAYAGPRTIDDCEAIKEPNAYNLCLASFGPMRGQHGASYPGVASEGAKGGSGKAASRSVGAARGAAASRGYGAAVARTTGGRVRMEFTPGRR